MISSRPASSAMLSVMGSSGRALMKRARGDLRESPRGIQESFDKHLPTVHQASLQGNPGGGGGAEERVGGQERVDKS